MVYICDGRCQDVEDYVTTHDNGYQYSYQHRIVATDGTSLNKSSLVDDLGRACQNNDRLVVDLGEQVGAWWFQCGHVIADVCVSEYVYAADDQMQGVQMDVAPFISDDRTFVPVRFLGNALDVSDADIAWDAPTQTITLVGDSTLSMTIGQTEVVSDGASKAIDVAPMIVEPGRTMLPARFVAEGLGYQVDWDAATQTVLCWPAGEPKPDVSAAVDYLVGQEQQGETSTTMQKETTLVEKPCAP